MIMHSNCNEHGVRVEERRAYDQKGKEEANETTEEHNLAIHWAQHFSSINYNVEMN